MKRLIVLFASAVVLLSGCYGDDMFERPTVVSVSPEGGDSSVLHDSRIVVQFSSSMDTVKTNEEFSLSSGSGRADGYYQWSGDCRTLTFTPKQYLAMAEKYTIRVTGSAEDSRGNDLKDEFISTFYTGGDLGRPAVLSYSPAANSIGNPESCAVTIVFSEPVLMNTVYSGISISPSVEGIFTADADGAVVTFTPRYGFSFGNTYTVNISAGVKDEAGNPLLVPAAFRFTVGDDFTKPVLSAYQLLDPHLLLSESHIVSGAEKDGIIILDFSEEIITDNLESAVSISPAADFFVSCETVAESGITFTRGKINFTENLSGEETYTLRINSTVKDLQNNPLDHDYRFLFRTDGPGSIRPVVVSIGDMQSDYEIDVWSHGTIPVLNWGKSGLTGLYDEIGIEFSNSINPSTLIIRVERAAGDGGTPSAVNIDWPASVNPAFSKVKFGLYKVLEGNTYRIIIKGGKNGLRDYSGNYMKDDYMQLVRF